MLDAPREIETVSCRGDILLIAATNAEPASQHVDHLIFARMHVEWGLVPCAHDDVDDRKATTGACAIEEYACA
jgi:hypothetical protein